MKGFSSQGFKFINNIFKPSNLIFLFPFLEGVEEIKKLLSWVAQMV
jgi:F0F1-type ATP synthase membrane subunit a